MKMIGSIPEWLSVFRQCRTARRDLADARRPQFEAEVRLRSNGRGPQLHLTLSGPATLSLDDQYRVIVSVEHETRTWTEPQATDHGDPAKVEYRKRYVQGPFRLASDGSFPDGQRADSVPMRVGEERVYALEHQHAPPGYGDPRDWGDMFGDLPMRLRIDASLDVPHRFHWTTKLAWTGISVIAHQVGP